MPHFKILDITWTQWKHVLGLTWESSGKNNVTLVAAGVAFYAFLAFVPLLAAMFLIFGIVADHAILASSVNTMAQVMPPEAAAIVSDQLTAIVTQSGSQKGIRLFVALLLALFGAMRAASAIVMALNVAYEVRETRSFVRVNLTSMALTIGLAAVLIAGAIAVSVKGSLDQQMTDMPFWLESIFRVAVFVVSIAAVSAVIAAIYRYAPSRPKARWSWITPGSLIATLGALGTVVLFAIYVANFSGYTATYGALGAIIVMLMWLWLTSLALCVGAEINGHLERLLVPERSPDIPAAKGGQKKRNSGGNRPRHKKARR